MLFEPIVDVRDVVQSYLNDRVLIGGWRGTLSKASARLVELGGRWSDDEVLELGTNVGLLATGSFQSDGELALDVARKLDAILDGLRIPGIPMPGDADWTFETCGLELRNTV